MTLNKTFRAYYIWPNFPSISISGKACSLNCLHCDGHYLSYMIPATTPERLVDICEEKIAEGAKGFLISGGCDKNGGLLNLEKILPAIKKVHDLGLIIKLHTGLVDKELAEGIASSGVDIASQEMVGDVSSISEIFGIKATPEDYLQTFELLQDAGIPHIAPHIVIGLHKGEIRGEFRALEMLKSTIQPSTIALIVIRPTKGTPLESVNPPTSENIREVTERARELFPETKMILGALRPRGPELEGVPKESRYEIELSAFEGGVNGMELPSTSLLAEARNRGYEIKRIDAYGVLPVEFEERLI